jgi:hypothetical protein
MKNTEVINLPETKRYLTILHGANVCSVVDSPFTSMKMDIYHQLRNLRISAEKVGEQVITKFSDLTENQAAAIRTDFEQILFTVEYLNGQEWDKIYKSLLAEIASAKPSKPKKEKVSKKQEKPAVDPIEALDKANPEPTNILPGGAEAINDEEEPEIVTVTPEPTPKKDNKPTKKDKGTATKPTPKPAPKKKAKK